MPYLIRTYYGQYVTAKQYAGVLKDGNVTPYRQHARHFASLSAAKSFARANPVMTGVIFGPSFVKV